MGKNTEFDVVLSFASEDNKFAEKIFDILKYRGIKVFKYDENQHLADAWGKNLQEHLIDIFGTKGQYCVMIISQYYVNKIWTSFERQIAQAQSLERNQAYILPIRLDDTEVPGLLPTTAYIDARHTDDKTIADLICKKLNKGIAPVGRLIATKRGDFLASRLNIPVDLDLNFCISQEEIFIVIEEIKRNFKKRIPVPFSLYSDELKNLKSKLVSLENIEHANIEERKSIIDISDKVEKLSSKMEDLRWGISVILNELQEIKSSALYITKPEAQFQLIMKYIELLRGVTFSNTGTAFDIFQRSPHQMSFIVDLNDDALLPLLYTKDKSQFLEMVQLLIGENSIFDLSNNSILNLILPQILHLSLKTIKQKNIRDKNEIKQMLDLANWHYGLR